MKVERTKNASRNIVFGVILKIVQIFIPFFMRTAMIYFMGVEYLGLNSLFTAILQVLNLAELGVGSAMIYSMYQPIAEDDTDTICALLNIYKRYYFTIGLVIAVVGVILTPIIPDLISGNIPGNLNVYILYLLHLSATVLSYWLFAYRGCVLSAHQRVDVSSKITIVTNLLQYGIQFFVLLYFKNYYLYLLVALATQAVTNIIVAFSAKKMFPNYKPRGNLDKEVTRKINQRVKDLFTAKIGGVIVNSVDTIVISAFLGLTVLAIYQNYFYILTSIIAFTEVVFSACTAGIGNSLIVETGEKNYYDLKKFTLLICWVAGLCTCCFFNLYQPFMELWVGKTLMLDFAAVICLCVYFYIYEINRLLNTYKDSGGIWHEDRFRPLITALANVMMNLALVHVWGIYGVLLSTALSMLFVGMPWLLHNLFSTMFEKKLMKEYISTLLGYTIHVIVSVVITYLLCWFITGNLIITLFFRSIICLIIFNCYYYIVYHRKKEFIECVNLIDKMTHYKFKLAKRLIRKVGS